MNLQTIILMGKMMLGITDKQIYFVAGGGCCGSAILGLWLWGLWSWAPILSILLFANSFFWFYIGAYT